MGDASRRGCLFVISAPSGAGKSTIVRQILMNDQDLAFSVSHTTRAPREGEQDGVHYHFVDGAAFERMRGGGEFLEWAEVHGERYGTARSEVAGRTALGRDVVLDIDLAGAEQVRDAKVDAVFIFILPPSCEELERRLARRGTEPPDQIARRMRRAREEIAGATFYDYLVVNSDLDRAVAELRAIVTAERCRAARAAGARLRVLESFP